MQRLEIPHRYICYAIYIKSSKTLSIICFQLSKTASNDASILAEHSCIKTKESHGKKRKHEDTENDLYKETIEELRLIRVGVTEINENLSQINETLKSIRDRFT